MKRRRIANRGRFGIKGGKSIYAKKQSIKSRNNLVAS